MKLKEFTEEFNKLVDDIGCMDNEEGYMGSHKIVSQLFIEDTEGELYEFVNLDVGTLGGCGCWADVTLMIKKVDE